MTSAQTQENLTSETIHQRFAEYGSNAKEWMKKCVLLLPEINRRKIWTVKGFGSIYEYAAKLAGMSREKVNDSLRILSKIENKPALIKVAEIKGLGAIRPVATIAKSNNQKFWAEKAMQLTKNELEIYVKNFKEMTIATDDGRPRTSETEIKNAQLFEQNQGSYTNSTDSISSTNSHPHATPTKEIFMELSQETASRLEKFKGDNDWETLMQEFLALKEEQIESTKPETRITDSRHIPTEIKRFVLEKYNSRCAFPGCHKHYSVLHHTERFFLEHEHNPDTIIPLCKTHHALAHKGFISNENLQPKNWQVRIIPELSIADRMTTRYRKN